jgi:hypothetical protein
MVIGAAADLGKRNINYATLLGGTCRRTTDPADTMAPSPMRTPGKMMDCLPIHTSSPMVTGCTSSGEGGSWLRRARG